MSKGKRNGPVTVPKPMPKLVLEAATRRDMLKKAMRLQAGAAAALQKIDRTRSMGPPKMMRCFPDNGRPCVSYSFRFGGAGADVDSVKLGGLIEELLQCCNAGGLCDAVDVGVVPADSGDDAEFTVLLYWS